MNHFALSLVICSTFMHAGWNLLTRNQQSTAIFFSRMLKIIALLGFIPFVISEMATHSLSTTAWLCVVGSGSFCGTYFYFLARSYNTSDFTVVYPVARALPVFFVGIGDTIRGNFPSTLGWAGMFLIILGCFLAPLISFRNISIRSYLRKSSLWMALTALCTVGYTLLDKIASEVIKEGPGTAARYGYMFFLIAYFVFVILNQKIKLKNHFSFSPFTWVSFLAAIFTFGAYWLVLWAYQLSKHASYVIAVRQFSIVIGVILAFIIYKESGKSVRLFAVLLITLGLLIIGFWG